MSEMRSLMFFLLCIREFTPDDYIVERRRIDHDEWVGCNVSAGIKNVLAGV